MAETDVMHDRSRRALVSAATANEAPRNKKYIYVKLPGKSNDNNLKYDMN